MAWEETVTKQEEPSGRQYSVRISLENRQLTVAKLARKMASMDILAACRLMSPDTHALWLQTHLELKK